MIYGESYERYLSRIAPDPFTVCEICDERVHEDDVARQSDGLDVCEECAALSHEEQCAIVERYRQRQIAKARAQGRVSFLEDPVAALAQVGIHIPKEAGQ